MGPSLQKRQQLGKPSEDPGKVGVTKHRGWKKICKLEGKKVICFDGAFLLCVRNGAALLGSTYLFCTTLLLSIWGNIQLSYKIGHLSTLVMLLVDSAEIATAQEKFSLESLL